MSDETSQPSTETQETVVTDNGTPTEQTISYAGGKYDSVSALENGYSELQKSYSQKLGGFDGSPENYELADGVESNPQVEALMKWGKDNQLNNEALNSIIEMSNATSDIQAEEQNKAREAYVQEQKDLLGVDAQARLANLSDWAKVQIGEESMEAFNGMITSAKGVEIIESFMKSSQGTSPSQVQSKQVVDRDTLSTMRFAKDEFGNRKMSSDPAYRAKVEAMEAEAHAR